MRTKSKNIHQNQVFKTFMRTDSKKNFNENEVEITFIRTKSFKKIHENEVEKKKLSRGLTREKKTFMGTKSRKNS